MVLEDHSSRSLRIVEDLKNEETTFFKAATSQLAWLITENCLHT